MNIKSIRAHHFNEFRRRERTDLDNSGGRRWDDDFKKQYFAFTCMEYSEAAGKLFCGTTNMSLDLLQTFDPVTKEFECMGYFDFSEDSYEVKIHRSLALGKDGELYGATSCLYPLNERLKAPGGKVFRFDYESRSFELLTIPKEHDYVQTISLDPERQMIYGFTYPVFEFFAYSIAADEIKYMQYVGSIPHLSAIDDKGGYWATWDAKRHNLFRYDPDANEVEFFQHGFPKECRNLMYPGAGPIDMALNIGDGGLYIAHEQADLYRLDPESAELEYLGSPYPSVRMPGLAEGPDNVLFCAGGVDYGCRLAVYDLKKGSFRELGALVDTETGEKCFRVHDLVVLGDTLYVGETDHPERSNHLWEIELEE